MSDEPRPHDRLIDDREVCHLFSLSRTAVWRWVKLGRIPAPVVRMHRYTRWSENQVHAAIEALKAAASREQISSRR